MLFLERTPKRNELRRILPKRKDGYDQLVTVEKLARDPYLNYALSFEGQVALVRFNT